MCVGNVRIYSTSRKLYKATGAVQFGMDLVYALNASNATQLCSYILCPYTIHDPM